MLMNEADADIFEKNQSQHQVSYALPEFIRMCVSCISINSSCFVDSFRRYLNITEFVII